MRRVLALALACSLVVLLGRPVFAAEPLAEAAGSPLEQAPTIRPFESAHYGLVGTVKFDGVTIDVLGEGDLALPDQQRGTFKFGPVTAEIVMTDDNVYTRTRFDPIWSREPATEPLTLGPISASELAQLGRDVRLIGTERVGGVATIHYSTPLDFQSVLGPLQPVIDDPEVSEVLESLTGTVDVWVGAEDRLVRQERIVLSIRLPEIEPGGDPLTATVDFTLAYSQLNEPVTISAPPRNDPSPIRTPRPDVVPVAGPPGAAAGAGQPRPGAPAQAPVQVPRR